MNSKRLNICLLLPTPFDPTFPSRPAVTEIYGKYLPSFGHKVTWVTPSLKKGRRIYELFLNKVHVYTIPHPLASSLPLKIFNFILYYIMEYKLLTTIFKEEKYDIIQVRNDVFGALLAVHIKIKYKIPFVFQYSFPKGVYKVQKPEKAYSLYFGKFESYITKYILHKADLIFPISKWMKTELIKEAILESKMMPLPMGVNQELFSENKNGMKIQEMYKLKGAQIIIYVGPLDKLRQTDVIIHAFSKIRKHRDNVKLLMVGKEDDKTNLEELASTLGIQADIIFTGQVPYFDVPDYIAAADICICPVPPLDIYKVSSPTKMFEYMVMRKPVVANEEIPEQKEVIKESGGGVLVKFEDESFAKGIIELLDNQERAKEMGRKGHEWVVKNRSYENMARQVEEIYLELLRG
jgi:glycosyltransferase involved in cell wall biosynthesis